MECWESCRNILNDDGRWPRDDCRHNASIGVMAKGEKENEGKQSKEKGA